MIVIHEIYQDPKYLLTWDEFQRIPAETELIDYLGFPVYKTEQRSIYFLKVRGKTVTQYSWTHALAQKQGLENMFMCFLLGS